MTDIGYELWTTDHRGDEVEVVAAADHPDSNAADNTAESSWVMAQRLSQPNPTCAFL